MQTFDYTKPYADFDMAEVMGRPKEKGIEIIGHHETGGNIFNYERQLDNAYKWYADLGVHSVKTGYAGRTAWPSQPIMDSSMYAITARWCNCRYGYHTTVNVHEPIKDTGIRRNLPQYDDARRRPRHGVERME